MKWAIDIGSAAEAYVYYRLRTWGYDAQFASGLGSPFDIWVPDNDLALRIQVKGTSTWEKRGANPYGGAKIFCFATGKGGGKKQHYEDYDYDILALVALPLERVYFTTEKVGKRKRISANKFDDFYERKTWNRSYEQAIESKC